MLCKASMKKFLFLVLPFALSFCSSKPDASSKPEEIVLVPWNSQESVERLARSEQKADFFPLSNNFDSQENGLVCGLASSSTVLNALRLRKKEDLPVDKSSISKRESRHLPKDYSPYFEKYTQENVFNKKTKSKLALLGKPIEINGKRQKDFGLQLHQLAQLLRSHGVSVLQRVVHDESESKTVREEIIENLSSEGDFILVNYARKSLNQTGGGHISPLGAYLSLIHI